MSRGALQLGSPGMLLRRDLPCNVSMPCRRGTARPGGSLCLFSRMLLKSSSIDRTRMAPR